MRAKLYGEKEILLHFDIKIGEKMRHEFVFINSINYLYLIFPTKLPK